MEDIPSIGSAQDTVEYLNREIEANEKLLKYKNAYALTELDIKSIEENLEYYYSLKRRRKMFGMRVHRQWNMMDRTLITGIAEYDVIPSVISVNDKQFKVLGIFSWRKAAVSFCRN